MNYAKGGLIPEGMFQPYVAGEQSTEAWIPVKESQQPTKENAPNDDPWEYENYHL